MGWTPQQDDAIQTKTGDGNLLVSAAAGSGKTAVLVERILQKIIKKETTADRLLVVTFTEAAASEMREKIINRLIKEMNEDRYSSEEKRFLKNQIRLSETADIMTIDAFCNRVVQNNFHILGADPNVSIADSAMGQLLKAEATAKLFNRLYNSADKEENEKFSRLLEAYASNRNEAGLEKLIYHVYDFITSFAEPEKWLDDMSGVYTLPLSQMPHMLHLENVSRSAAEKCTSEINALLIELSENTPESDSEIYDEITALTQYTQELFNIAQSIENAKDCDGIFEIYKLYFKKTSGRKKQISPVQSPVVVENKENNIYAEKINFIRNTFIDRLSNGITESVEKISEACNMPLLFRHCSDIVWIVKEFIKEYTLIKDRKKVREFSDIEHMTYRLFRDYEDIKNNYKNKYDEILIDEYQDTNGLQDAIFNLISHDNIFMVGDLKQSIYRFRGGDPYIFKHKSNTYGTDKSNDNKIVLSQNFRSRYEILDSVNDIFTTLMSADAGDVEYTDDELIVREKERDYYPPVGMNCKSELDFIAVDKNGDLDRHNAEIIFTADKIAELLSSEAKVFDKDLNGMRPIRKRDIVILENSVKANGSLLVNELSKRGIDAFTEIESFFDRREIQTMLSLLTVIDNSRQDIPLIAVMRSPIGGFSENDLVRIRLASKTTDNFISAVRSYADGNNLRLNRSAFRFASGSVTATDHKKHNDNLCFKCRKFIGSLRRWRGYMRTKSVAELIWSIYEETYFYDIMGAIEKGEEAQLNLHLLYERAKTYESAGFKGLFNFIRYIEQIEGRDEDLGGAKLVGENHDVVRIMTIHKSKGLEFPVVFLLGAGKDFPPSKDFASVRLHKELGFGLPHIYYDEHYMQETKIMDIIKLVNHDELAAERLRLLYVALTRAREKLYVTVSRNINEGETDENIISAFSEDITLGKMLPSKVLAAKGFYSWICPAALANENTWDFNIIHPQIRDEEEAEETTSEETFEESEELKKSVFEILDYSYPYPQGNEIPSRTSVTQIKELTIERMANEESEFTRPVYEPDNRRSSSDDMAELMFSPLHVKPAFMREKGEKAANEIGTLYHLVMSEINLSLLREKGIESIDSEIDRLILNATVSEEDRGYIDVDKIKAFYKSEIGQRLLASKEIHRETPFQINIPATEYNPMLGDEYKDETVILQGIIDCFFEENGNYILLDYKTDKVKNNSNEIKIKYLKQLELYTKAIETLTDKKVSESRLYLFDTDEVV